MTLQLALPEKRSSPRAFTLSRFRSVEFSVDHEFLARAKSMILEFRMK